MTKRKKGNDDGLPTLQFRNAPVLEMPIDLAEFVDIDTGQMLAPSKNSLVGPTGRRLMRASSMKINEAMSHAAKWWNSTARHAMPDQPKVKGNDYLSQYGVASNILLGYEWDRLTKEEKLKILKAWWLNIGVPKHVHGLDVNSDSNKGVLH